MRLQGGWWEVDEKPKVIRISSNSQGTLSEGSVGSSEPARVDIVAGRARYLRAEDSVRGVLSLRGTCTRRDAFDRDRVVWVPTIAPFSCY